MSTRSTITGIEAARRRLERRRQRTQQELAALRDRAGRSARTAAAGPERPADGLVHDLAAVRARVAAREAPDGSVRRTARP